MDGGNASPAFSCSPLQPCAFSFPTPFLPSNDKKGGQETGEAVCGTPKPCTSFCLSLVVFLCASHLERHGVPVHGFGLENTSSSFAPSERKDMGFGGPAAGELAKAE